MVKPPRVGDRVIVPFGPGEIEGEVIRVGGKGERTWITLELFLGGSDDDAIDPHSPREPFVTTYRAREIIRPAEAA
jgi:hypothetical protein